MKQDQLDQEEKFKFPSQGRQVFTRWVYSYPNLNSLKSKTFYIKYNKNLSTVDKIILNNFQNKYLYHAIEDIISALRSKPIQQNNLLPILYSPIIYLQNNLAVDFFDIWIDEIYINEITKVNKFLSKNQPNLEPYRYITMKLIYSTKSPRKKQETLW
jgi:hypothetical protein